MQGHASATLLPLSRSWLVKCSGTLVLNFEQMGSEWWWWWLCIWCLGSPRATRALNSNQSIWILLYQSLRYLWYSGESSLHKFLYPSFTSLLDKLLLTVIGESLRNLYMLTTQLFVSPLSSYLYLFCVGSLATVAWDILFRRLAVRGYWRKNRFDILASRDTIFSWNKSISSWKTRGSSKEVKGQHLTSSRNLHQGCSYWCVVVV